MNKYLKKWDFILLTLAIGGFFVPFVLFGTIAYKLKLTPVILKGISILIIILLVTIALINILAKKKAVNIILKIVLCSLTSIFVSMYFVQDTMVFIGYYNQDMWVVEEENNQLSEALHSDADVETFTLKNHGATLKGWMKISTNPNSPTLVIFNGNAGLANYTFDMYRQISDDYNILVVDYRGYGNSAGMPNQNNTKSDALAIIDYLSDYENFTKNGIYVLGYSIGTELATYVAMERDISGLILVTPFNSLTNIYNDIVPVFYGPLKLLIKYDFSPAQNIKSVDEDVLIICSNDDGMFTVEMAQEVKDNVKGNAQIVVFDGVDHNSYFEEPYNEETYQYINQFISDCSN